MRLPDEAYELTTTQLGVLARWQLAPLVGLDHVDELLRGPGFERLHRGVYAVRGGARHRHRDAVAATLRVGPRATLTGPAALGLLELEGVELGAGFTVLRPPGHRVTGIPFPVQRDRDPDRPITLLGQVRVAPVADALLDSLSSDPPPRPRALRLAHDRLRWEGLLRPGEIAMRAAHLRLPPTQRSQELLALDASQATGDGERQVGRILSRFDPPPEPQVWVSPHRCIDWYFRSLLLGVEYQGAPDHATDDGRRGDRVRDDELAMAGIELLYVTAADLRSEGAVAARVATALTSRAYALGVAAPRLRPAG